MKRYKKLFEREEITMKDIEEVFSEKSFNELVSELINELKESWSKDIQDIGDWFEEQFQKRNIVNEKMKNLIKDFVIYFKNQNILKEVK